MSCKSYEVLNVVMVVIIWAQTDRSLGDNFWHYGSEVYGNYVHNEPTFDVMCNAFPTVVSLFDRKHPAWVPYHSFINFLGHFKKKFNVLKDL